MNPVNHLYPITILLISHYIGTHEHPIHKPISIPLYSNSMNCFSMTWMIWGHPSLGNIHINFTIVNWIIGYTVNITIYSYLLINNYTVNWIIGYNIPTPLEGGDGGGLNQPFELQFFL